MYQNIKHFKGLNALRFFAAYMVVLHHAEQIRLKNGLFNLKSYSLFNNGGLAVTFFFVLSGFLISYLLLKEIKSTQTVSIKKFYVRRILRIWPLYYLLVLLGTVIIPTALQWMHFPYDMPYTFGQVIGYYVFFAPFMVNILFGHHLLEPLWSIGVEEVFYIMWAPLFKWLKRAILPLTISVIVLKTALLLSLPYFNWPATVVELIKILQFEAMAIGGLSAYLIFHSKKNLASQWLFSKVSQLIIILFILLRIFAWKYLITTFPLFEIVFKTPVLSPLLVMFLFAWLIVNVAVNSNSILNLERKSLNFLGNLSYGIYMYHMIIIFALILVGKSAWTTLSPWIGTLAFYIVMSALVITVSYFSKIWFEDKFLRLKEKFRVK